MATLNHEIPPLFNRGPGVIARLFFLSLLSILLIVIDAHFQTADSIRNTLRLVIEPLERVARIPAAKLVEVKQYFSDLSNYRTERETLNKQKIEMAGKQLRLQYLETENNNLHNLLGVRPLNPLLGKVVKILRISRDPFSRRVTIDSGSQHGLMPGSPVIDAQGLIGQLTHLFTLSSEVTLLTSKHHSTPVQVARTGFRTIVFGLGSGQLKLERIPALTDIQAGDVLVTSGLDDFYPAGLPVAIVDQVVQAKESAFMDIHCKPVAAVEHHNALMILKPKAHPEFGDHPILQSVQESTHKAIQ